MNNSVWMMIIAAAGTGIVAALRMGIKSYRKKGHLDGSVVADALEAGLGSVDKCDKKG